MAGDVPNRFDRDDILVDLDFVAFHYLLNCFAEVVHPGINPIFLSVELALQAPYRADSLTLSPVLVAALPAASK